MNDTETRLECLRQSYALKSLNDMAYRHKDALELAQEIYQWALGGTAKSCSPEKVREMLART